MKNEKNISILKEMAESVKTCMLITLSHHNEFGSRPMGTAKIEDDGSIWFYTNEYSPKSKEISKENNVLLAYSEPSKNVYLTVKGKAELVDNRVKKEAYFSPFVKAWFPDGIEDPRLILIKVSPVEAEYWDASSSKIVVLFNLLRTVATGETPDLGKHDTMKF